MADIKKPLATIEVAAAAVSLVKTAAIVFVMMMLEWARLKERKAQVNAAAAENDLAVAKETAKLEGAKEGLNAKDQVDKYLHSHGLPPGKSGKG